MRSERADASHDQPVTRPLRTVHRRTRCGNGQARGAVSPSTRGRFAPRVESHARWVATGYSRACAALSDASNWSNAAGLRRVRTVARYASAAPSSCVSFCLPIADR